MRIRILPYAMRSSGARRLSEELQARGVDSLRVHPDGAYKPRIGDLIVLWGHGNTPDWWRDTKGIRVLNHPDSICSAINKIEALKLMDGRCNVVPWTTSPRQARDWWGHEQPVVCRHQTEGLDGSGLEVVWPDTFGYKYNAPPDAPLYTKFIPSKAEYRIHVFGGRVIIGQRKGPSPGGDPVTDEHIRTERNGWTFLKTPPKEIPEEVEEQAVRAVNALSLDFGGVDVLWDGEQAWVLEVNTAPSIMGTDVPAYAECLMQIVKAA